MNKTKLKKKHKRPFLFYKSLRIGNFEMSLIYNNSLKQWIFNIGKRTFPAVPGEWFKLKTTFAE